MKPFLLLTALLCALVVLPTRAQTTLGVHAGYDVDFEEFLVGAQARFPFSSLPITVQPGVDVFFVDNVTVLQFDVNALYAISGGAGESFTPYVGAGLGILYASNDGHSDTSGGLNLLAGAVFNPAAALRPFVQARMTVDDGTRVAVMGGVLFAIGR